tara:strand:+ start:2672 stop:3952 length:1281 start_codon:yes stop_codon:yes gene_type:complete
MLSTTNFKKLSFLVYGLGLTGQSVVKFFKKNNFKNFQVWDDKIKNLYKSKRTNDLTKTLKTVNFIVLSPGVSFNKNIKRLKKYKRKIITDIDLIFLLYKFKKSIVVTGTNGKSTTCKIIAHVLKNNKFKVLLGGNIGTPILDLKVKKNTFLIIEASSYQLAHSKFIQPDYAFLLNISNDHLDWHGNMKNYVNSKFKIFKHQKKFQYSFVNKKLKKNFQKRKFSGKLIIPNTNEYTKLKAKIKNPYFKMNINDENMSFIYSLSKFFNISKKSFIKSLKSFDGLPHRYEIFLKKKNCTFINDSKATSFNATKYALASTKNIYWILGGLPKKNDRFYLKNFKKDIIKSYIIGKNVNFFKKQVKNQINYFIAKNLNKALIQIFKDLAYFKKKNNSILFSPASASFDQFLNFEKRGEEFKRLSKYHVKKYI